MILALLASSALIVPSQEAAAQSPAAEVDRLRGYMAAAKGNGGVMYALAKALAQAGQGEEAVRWLKSALDQGLDLDLGDAAFKDIRDREDFKEQLARADAIKPVSNSRLAFRIPDPELIPEGIAWDAKTGDFFVGSLYKRKIVRIAPDGTVSDFAPSGKDGLQDVLGMKVDPERRILWACTAASGRSGPAAGSSALFKFNLASDKPPQAYWLEADGNKHLLNDLALTAGGDVYVTDSDANTIWRLAKDAERLEVFAGPGTFLYPNGIALSSDDKRMYVADFKHGLSVIDVATKASQPMAYPENVSTAGIDGLYLNGASLIAVQNGAGRERIVRYRLNATGDAVEGLEVLESRNPFFRIPTTGVVAVDDFVYLANPNLEALNDDGHLKIGQHVEAITVLRVHLR